MLSLLQNGQDRGTGAVGPTVATSVETMVSRRPMVSATTGRPRIPGATVHAALKSWARTGG